MFHLMRAAGLLFLPAALMAQTGPAPVQAPAPIDYRSAFEGYQAFGDDQPLSWQQVNDTVREIGGWRAYAREAQANPPAPPAAAPTPAPADPHGGHGKH